MIGVPNCEICAINAGRENLILETGHWIVTLSKDQSNLGSSFISLIDHKESLSDVTTEEWQEFIGIIKRIEAGYLKAFGGNGQPFNWACMMNNAYKAEKPVPHVHWHVRPRHAQPTTIAGVEFVDLEYAHQYEKSRTFFVDQNVLDAIIAQIKPHI